MRPIVHFDPAADAAYIHFSSAPVVESEEVADGVILDFDAEGRIVGLEVLDARAHLPADTLEAAE